MPGSIMGLQANPYSEMAGLAQALENAPDQKAVASAFARAYPPVLARMRRYAGVTPVDSHPFGGYFQSTLVDGSIGYFQRRLDDCLQAAIASLCQMPPHEVPDLQLHKQLFSGVEFDQVNREATERMNNWLRRTGLAFRRHAILPTTGRWIGVTHGPPGSFDSHCLLMCGRRVLFDPSNPLPRGEDEPPSWAVWGDVEYGITLD